MASGWCAHQVAARSRGGPLILDGRECLLPSVFCSVTGGGPRRHGAQGHLGQQERFVADQLEDEPDNNCQRETDVEHGDAPVLDYGEFRRRIRQTAGGLNRGLHGFIGVHGACGWSCASQSGRFGEFTSRDDTKFVILKPDLYWRGGCRTRGRHRAKHRSSRPGGR